jgi:hypothetical protein
MRVGAKMNEPNGENVYLRFKMLAAKIQDVYPEWDLSKEPTSQIEHSRRAVVSDIQQRLAEIYAVLIREIKDDSLDINYTVARAKFSQRLSSVLNLIAVVALATKTKLNINKTEKLFDDVFIANINAVCLQCFKLKSILSEIPDPVANTVFEKGVVSRLEYTYYQTGITKNIRPGSVKGQILSTFASTAEEHAEHSNMNRIAREKLDRGVKAPTLEERTLVTVNPFQLEMPQEIFQPKRLSQYVANFVIKNKTGFFKDLARLDGRTREKFPELDIDYKAKFINGVKKLILGITFKPTVEEEKYLGLLANALGSDNPYNSVHSVLQEMDKVIKSAFLSMFKKNMQPIRAATIELMKQYAAEKKEYAAHFGRGL